MIPPSFVIDLDLLPEQRYAHVINQFNIEKIKVEVNKLYNDFLPKIPFINSVITHIVKSNISKMMYYDEILYWSIILNIPFHKIVLLQFIYELNSACTTFVTTIKNKRTMYRTMDWHLDLLKYITYTATFIKHRRPIYDAVCWLGAVGIFTGKNNEYSLAMNYRCLNNITFKSIFHNYTNCMNLFFPASYLIRDTLENNNYEETKKRLCLTKLISPVYFTINHFDGVGSIIQRTSESFNLITDETVIQTNCDNDIDPSNILFSHERLHQVRSLLNSCDKNKQIRKKLLIEPVINEATVYFCMMNKTQFKTIVFN